MAYLSDHEFVCIMPSCNVINIADIGKWYNLCGSAGQGIVNGSRFQLMYDLI
jgi:hypothetical protein